MNETAGRREIARGTAIHDETHHVFQQITLRERHIRYTIAALVLVFGVVGFIGLFSPQSAQGSVIRSLIIGTAAATTLPTAIMVSRIHLGEMWWTKRSRVRGFNTLFVIYADVGLSICLFATADPALALYFCALFAVVGSYCAHFVRPVVAYVHMAFSSLVTCVLGINTWFDGSSGLLAFSTTLALLVAVNATVTLHQGYTSDLQKTLKHQLRMANTDPLTGLLNRRGFILATTTLLRRGPASHFAFAIVDVDRFKRINDDHGHATGDLVLQRLAGILEDAVDDPAVVARLGGDEFAIAMQLDEPSARVVAEQICGRPIELGDGNRATVSLGLAVGPVPGGRLIDDAATTRIQQDFARADAALFDAKATRRGTYAIAPAAEAPPPATGSPRG
ncbi:GGDEF domain-containing protein [Gordonia aurantiaca]|uniref:GGDEF domain-containing protein n=1 Tax=Gordonia sp. B21 TaxID=3151852 RepID=UPI0032647919